MCIQQFKVRATDDGNPSRSNEVRVILTVIRTGLPTFNPPFITQISENTDPGAQVLTVDADHPIFSVSAPYSQLLMNFQ